MPVAVGPDRRPRRSVRPATGAPRPRATPAASPASGLDPVHLLLRTTFGLAPALLDEVRTVGPQAWLESQLAPERLDDSACDAVVGRLPLLTRTAAQLRAELRTGAWEAMEQLVVATVARACWSRRQLLEVMVELWSNHLNVTCPSSEVWDVRAVDDREVYRRHALGRFSDLLVASAKSPSMLLYLDGASSTAASPNENYGRELLELHTVGVDAGYTETEVRHSALALTGFTVGADRRFAYNAKRHHVGPLSVLGWSSPNVSAAGGLAVAEDYLRYLAVHPATARRVATKLAVRFVSDTPPAALVDRLAAAYLAAGSAIVPVLRVLFASPEFAASAGQKSRRPFEELTGVVRGCGIEPPRTGVEGVRGLMWLAGDRGQAPLGWHPPNGYPDVAAAWQGAGTTVRVWGDQLMLAAGWWPKDLQHLGAEALLPASRATCGALVDGLADRLLHRSLPPAERTALIGFLGGDERAVPSREAVGWQLPHLVSLVLATPTWSQR